MSQFSLENRFNSPRHDAVSGAGETPPGEANTSQEPLPTSPDSAMIVFSSAARILHMNGPAHTLMALFGQSHELWPNMAAESMPSFLTEFCRDVLAQLRHQIDTEDWAQFELRRTCHMVTPSLLLTGFGVPNTSGRELRIIVTLNPLHTAPRTADVPAHLQTLAQPSTARVHA